MSVGLPLSLGTSQEWPNTSAIGHSDGDIEHQSEPITDTCGISAVPESAPAESTTIPIITDVERATDCPRATAPIWHQIPAELQARPQWVCWCYGARDGKPTKVPYNVRTAKPASTTAPRTWSSFQDAKQAYLDRPDFYEGIGYVFSKDDPYCGADFDHCINDAGEISSWAAEWEAQLQAAGAYTETSVSGTGVHAITCAALAGKGCKTPQGEVYDRGRYFTFSGRRRPGSTPIGDGQAVVDGLAAELRGSTSASNKLARDAGQLEEHSAEEWEEARRLQRTERERLVKRSLAATAKEGTQGFFAARGLWADFHKRWPFVGMYRSDGSLDDSQARAVMACSLRRRGFTFPEYAVIMSHHFAAYCLAKWGTKDAWRAELERLWNLAPAAKHAPAPSRQPDVAISPKLRGRASNHAEQVERVFQQLLDHRAGAQALVQIAEQASEADMHRVTFAGILAELRAAGRIVTRRNGRYGGLIVEFPDVAIVSTAEATEPATVAQTVIEPAAPLEETRVPNSTNCVSSEQAPVGYSSPAVDQALVPQNLAEAVELVLGQVDKRDFGRQRLATVRQTLAVVYGYTDTEAVNAEIKRQESIFVRERHECWQLDPDRLVARVQARTKAATRNTGKRTEAKYRTLLEIAEQVRQRRGIAMPDMPVRQPSAKPSKPARAKQARPLACQPLQFELPLAPAVGHHRSELQMLAPVMPEGWTVRPDARGMLILRGPAGQARAIGNPLHQQG